jgi:hypothetical protein
MLVTNTKLSKIAKSQSQQVPLLKASSIGDERFISFVADQARSHAGARLVVQSLEAHLEKGERLDGTFWQILAIARATVKRSDVSAAFN